MKIPVKIEVFFQSGQVSLFNFADVLLGLLILQWHRL